MNNKINEDGEPVTTTANAGDPLISPQLPITPKNILTRYKDMKKKTKAEKVDSKSTNIK